MAKNMFGGLENLVKGFSNLLPQDDPNVILLKAQEEVNGLQAQQQEVYAEIGKKAAEQLRDRPDILPLVQRAELVNQQLEQARAKLAEIQGEREAAEQKRKQEQEAAEQKRREELEALTCAMCGHIHDASVKFCQECGAKLGAAPKCPGCGAKVPMGTRFCGECGCKIAQE